jgi:hypothetical protein
MMMSKVFFGVSTLTQAMSGVSRIASKAAREQAVAMVPVVTPV